MKIIDLIEKRISESKVPFYSFEYFPPKTEKGVENLYDRMDRMSTLEPLWIDITCLPSSTSKLTFEICQNAQNYFQLESMMHVTCVHASEEEIKDLLDRAKAAGIQNILALRGDLPRGESNNDRPLNRAVDLVRFIRKEYGDHFGITVAGYPEGHSESNNYEEDLKFLKEKIEAGADFIVTQYFYDVNVFLKFVKDCRALGITCPIIPGLMPIQTYAGFTKMASLSKILVPQEVTDALSPIKNDDQAVKEYGIKLFTEMCRNLFDSGVSGIHFYTMNLEKLVTEVLTNLDLINDDNLMARPLPWARHSEVKQGKRAKEEVRPIFWRNRPKSYIYRTNTWDEFPNGRWGDSGSPAFGELSDYHLTSVRSQEFERKEAYGKEVKSEQDVYNLFARYCAGEADRLPWCESALSSESEIIQQQLIRMNKAGLLTINSQPRINAIPSTDEKYGWGPKGGYVYQKAYLEFFISPADLQILEEVFKKYPSLAYHAVNKEGKSLSNFKIPAACAVTWGVFPNREIIQPTVVDSESFLVWKDEAFGLWTTHWISLYKTTSPSIKILEFVRDNYFLVNVVDDNFVDGDIFASIEAIIQAKESVTNK
eukprot:TRINITY_DN4706_c0_g1_i1.p1 TRINITY_DN4706_c0_g1~~TRINITY_DN4706_c0_g1_i1.p1  ORF type:complete len:596 (+),score=215.73 TRINITY_DN4706_c0_g1_i1:440-2227(+)